MQAYPVFQFIINAASINVPFQIYHPYIKHLQAVDVAGLIDIFTTIYVFLGNVKACPAPASLKHKVPVPMGHVQRGL